LPYPLSGVGDSMDEFTIHISVLRQVDQVRYGETHPLSKVICPLFSLASPASFSLHWSQHDVFGECVVVRSVTEVFQFVRLDTGE